MGKRMWMKRPETSAEHGYLVACAVEDFASKVAANGGTATPREGIVAEGCLTYLLMRGNATKIGAVSAAVAADRFCVETVYLEPGWRGLGLLERVLRELNQVAKDHGLSGVYLRGPVPENVSRVGARLGIEIGVEPEGYHPEKAAIAEGDAYLLREIREVCPHDPSPCGPCSGMYLRRQLTVGGMYEFMLKGWGTGVKGVL